MEFWETRYSQRRMGDREKKAWIMSFMEPKKEVINSIYKSYVEVKQNTTHTLAEAQLISYIEEYCTDDRVLFIARCKNYGWNIPKLIEYYNERTERAKNPLPSFETHQEKFVKYTNEMLGAIFGNKTNLSIFKNKNNDTTDQGYEIDEEDLLYLLCLYVVYSTEDAQNLLCGNYKAVTTWFLELIRPGAETLVKKNKIPKMSIDDLSNRFEMNFGMKQRSVMEKLDLLESEFAVVEGLIEEIADGCLKCKNLDLKRGNEFLEYTKKIMNRGKLRSISEGNFIGSIPPYGYDKIFVIDGKRKCPTLAINEEQANIVRMIFDMYTNQNIGMPSICKHLDSIGATPPKGDHWSNRALKDMLSNVHYIGKVKWNWRKTITVVEDGEIRKTRPKSEIGEYLIYDGRHEAIITEDLFYATQEKLGKNPRIRQNMGIRNPFAGLLYCQCGRAMSLRTYKKKDGSQRNAPRLICDDHSHCGTGSCTYDEMLEMVKGILTQCIEDFEHRIKSDSGDAMKLHEKLLKSLEKKMQDLEAREVAQWESQSHPDPSQRMPPHIFAMLNEKLLKEKEEVKEAMCNARKSMPDPIDYSEKVVRFRNALEALDDPNRSAEDKNRLLKDCIERIDYNREKPQRIKSQKVLYYDKERKRTLTKSPLKTGGNWTKPPIDIDVKLKV